MDLLERTKKELERKIHWSKKVIVVAIYHTSRATGNPHWSCADTGRELLLSRAFVSEQIKLNELIASDPSVISLSRQKALRRLRDVS